jgi:hypothetical protein
MPASFFELECSDPNDIFLLFNVTLPFELHQKGVIDVARYVLLINKGLELPGFGMSEPDEVCYYRHVLKSNSSRLDEKELLSMVSYIEMTLMIFMPPLKELVEGKKSLEDLLKHCIKVSQDEQP